ncbi:ABC transporter ATP-binding protein [uncultured Paracoccus sp.]|uniref:ABC transporter ATP-binding protein n=1 Tax=uncultured Paracoccus sp. TaxID=189685 RepID=UPI002621FA12|nr:ABC transporter ATP-binding protein [uncultured Paracoccus sp.]
MIEIDNLTKTYGAGPQAYQALRGVTATVRANEFFTLLGPSGCGKTTLLRMIAGFETPTSGKLLLDGQDVSASPPYRRPVNTVFQSYALFPHMTCAENIGFGLKMLGKPKAEITRTVGEMLDLVQMTPMANRRPSQLSGGQQQRIALARALAPKPKVLLLDEPLSALDYKLRKDMQIELKRIQKDTGITFVFVTHDQEEALTMSDRIAIMNAGTIRQIGSPRDIYDQPAERFVADFIGETNFLTVGLLGVAGQTARVALPSGRELDLRAPGELPKGPQVTMAIRPEHLELVAADAGQLSGRLSNIVYFGTDTHFHVDLGEGGALVVRSQNKPDQMPRLTAGEAVGISVLPGTGQVLRD